jgi:DNA polymerase-1
MTKKKTLLLFDGHNIYIRAFSGLARQNLRNSEGIGTWGAYGTLNTIASMVRRYEPTHVLVAFDKGRSSKRLAIDSEYKANRNKNKEKKSTDDSFFEEFRPQMELTFELCKRIGIPFLRLQDVEADDIIAKAVREFRDVFDEIVIVSADHDIRQLIRHNVKVVKPSLGQKGIDEEVFGPEQIMEEWGVTPWRLPEIWALMGDKGDNIEGIRGIGPKKATKLIADYGSLEKAIEENELVAENEEIVRKAYSLIILEGLDDIPFPPLGSLQFSPVEPSTKVYGDQLKKLFDYFELTSITERWTKGTLWRKEVPFGRKLGV